MKRVLPILVLALAIPALVNCKKEEKDEPTPPPPVKVETISVNPDKIEINGFMGKSMCLGIYFL